MAGIIAFRHFKGTLAISQFYHPELGSSGLNVPFEVPEQVVPAAESERVEYNTDDMKIGWEAFDRMAGPSQMTLHDTPTTG